ncbi:MAG: hypothetical protein J0H99_24050, partial [Rhodospirillales bacterium]|nr:hypothetical protein [Rhodospirillales bacterium]
AFCLYGPNKDLNWIAQNPALTSLTALNKNLMFSDIHALDPWANTCCTLDRYPGLIETKMNSWGSYGKRILWVYDPTVNPPLWEWCEPNGEYKDVFAAGSLALGIC